MNIQLAADMDAETLSRMETMIAIQEAAFRNSMASTAGSNIHQVFKRVPAGQFMREDPNSGKRQRITLSRSFEISKYPVSQAIYLEVMGENPSSSNNMQAPVDSVKWRDAVAFCNKLSERDGLDACYRIRSSGAVKPLQNRNGYRLPTEAEWEYAAHGNGQQQTQFWSESNANNQVQGVGAHDENGYGIQDMLGNVWEWCWDIHASYEKGSLEDPQGPKIGEGRTCRGGGVDTSPADMCVSLRRGAAEDQPLHAVGFRIVKID